ncbi:MAG: hypothetical protein MJ143_06260 [Clostridia bacterium]|nr:hypothetical protein [Clostridia bacterium]
MNTKKIAYMAGGVAGLLGEMSKKSLPTAAKKERINGSTQLSSGGQPSINF